jgi:hypothetical protein
MRTLCRVIKKCLFSKKIHLLKLDYPLLGRAIPRLLLYCNNSSDGFQKISVKFFT